MQLRSSVLLQQHLVVPSMYVVIFFSLPSGKPFGAHCQKPDGDDRYDKCDDRLSVATR